VLGLISLYVVGVPLAIFLPWQVARCVGREFRSG